MQHLKSMLSICGLTLASVTLACGPATSPSSQKTPEPSNRTSAFQTNQQTNSTPKPAEGNGKQVIKIDKSDEAQSKRWAIIQEAIKQQVVAEVTGKRNDTNMLFAGRMTATIIVPSANKWRHYRNKQQLINAVFEYYCDGIEEDSVFVDEGLSAGTLTDVIEMYRLRPSGLRPSKGLVFDR